LEYDLTHLLTGGAVATTERVTVTLPIELIEHIDRLERNRSRFIAEAVRHEVSRRRREALTHSLRNPHPESTEWASMGLSEWHASLPAIDAGLIDSEAGTPVRWIEGEGWVEDAA
jgi:predicted transcriptional regulator